MHERQRAKFRVDFEMTSASKVKRTGRIEILSGPLQGQKHTFRSKVTIGRRSDNAIRLIDVKVSRTHAMILATEEGFRIKDLKSSNGTFVNGERIDTFFLKPGDNISIGLTDLRFSEKEVGHIQGNDPYATIALERRMEDVTHKQTNGRPGVTSAENAPGERFQAIMRINRAIGGDFEPKVVLEKVLEEIFLILAPGRGAVMALNEDTDQLEIVCSRPQAAREDMKDLLISRSILNTVLENSVGILIDDATTDSRFSLSESIALDKIRSALCVPLTNKNEVVGVIYLDAPTQVRAFTEQDLELLMSIAGPASVQIQNALYLSQLRKSYKDTIRALAKAVDARDPYTVGHNWRVSRLAVTVASAMGWSEDKLGTAELGGILHDIGKIGVPDHIFLKEGKLSEQEWEIMKQHPEIGARMIAGIDFLEPVLPYILYHHEHWDGGGYPYGLKGAEIPEEGRLLLVCDAYDAMTTTRPYKNGLEPETAIEELRQGKGRQFDPKYVDGFVTAWKKGIIAQALQSEDREHHPTKALLYSNFQSLVFSTDRIQQELQSAVETKPPQDP
jgi:HD-GYP domain-containing protein (c-di-GMP phosphodiesterase class II)/pSer/pThr/pTyr-binding forkhead associated (FHA) protein